MRRETTNCHPSEPSSLVLAISTNQPAHLSLSDLFVTCFDLPSFPCTHITLGMNNWAYVSTVFVSFFFLPGQPEIHHFCPVLFSFLFFWLEMKGGRNWEKYGANVPDDKDSIISTDDAVQFLYFPHLCPSVTNRSDAPAILSPYKWNNTE